MKVNSKTGGGAKRRWAGASARQGNGQEVVLVRSPEVQAFLQQKRHWAVQPTHRLHAPTRLSIPNVLLHQHFLPNERPEISQKGILSQTIHEGTKQLAPWKIPTSHPLPGSHLHSHQHLTQVSPPRLCLSLPGRFALNLLFYLEPLNKYLQRPFRSQVL